MQCLIVLNLLSCQWLLTVISDAVRFPTPQCLRLSEIMMLEVRLFQQIAGEQDCLQAFHHDKRGNISVVRDQ